MDMFGDELIAVPSEVDPAAEFLAREQDQLAGLEEDILAESEPVAAPQEESDFGVIGDIPVQDELNFEAEIAVQAAEVNIASVQAPNYAALPREEPEKILKWREEQKLRLEQKDEEEERKKKEMKEQAAKELEDWYKQHKETIEKTRSANRNAEKELVSQSTEVEAGQEWERIAKLCDFNPKAGRNSKDVSRMRSIILQLKQSPPTVMANGQ